MPKSTNAIQEKGFNFDDSRLMRGAWRNEPNPDMCKVFPIVYLNDHFLLFEPHLFLNFLNYLVPKDRIFSIGQDSVFKEVFDKLDSKGEKNRMAKRRQTKTNNILV